MVFHGLIMTTDSFGPIFKPNRRFWTHLEPNLMLWGQPQLWRDPASPVLMLVDHTDAGSETGLCAGELLLAPAFMSSAAEAQVGAALEALRGQKSTL